MVNPAFYRLRRKDEIMVIDAAALMTIENDACAYTLLIDAEDGRWLVFNNVTDSATEAARLLHAARKDGAIELSEWTDVSFLKERCELRTDKALRLGRRPLAKGSHRPMHPLDPTLSVLQEGDAARIIQCASPADASRCWWLVLISLSEGIFLQHVLPFETNEEALDLVKLLARTGAFVTEDFFDATDDIKSVQLDTSEEIEIDEDGKPRIH